MDSRWMQTGVIAAAMCLAGVSAYAQTSDADWLAQCRDHRGDSRVQYCEVRPVNLGWSGSLRVDANPNGGVQVNGSDQATAVTGSARIQVQAETDADAHSIASGITIDTSSGALHAVGPKTGDGRSWSVSFVLSAPRRGDLQIDATNGPVTVSGITGQIRATTVNGPLTLRGVGGDVHARATNGPLSIALTGTAWEGAGLDAQTQNGPLSVTVPEGYSASLEARTVNGPFHLGIPVAVQGEQPTRRNPSVTGTIGSGGAPIRVATTNGPVTIDKR